MDELENLRKRAKQLVRDHTRGQTTLAERLRAGLPRFAGMTDGEVLAAPFALHDAQQLLATELGFGSWSDLVGAAELPPPRTPPTAPTWRAFAQVFVRDVDASVAWYRDVLGFEVDYTYGSPPFYAQVRRDAIAFNLRHTDESPWALDPRADDHLAVRIEVADVKTLFLELRDRRVELHQTLRTEPWDQVTFIVRDPDGNLLSFGSSTAPT